MRTPAIAVACLVALAALAGCSGRGGNTTGDPTEDLDKYKATPTTGVIRGVVVDTAIRPLANVLLTTVADGKTLSANSTDTGAFGFQGLAPGSYFVKAHKPGYSDAQASVEVKANDNTPPILRIGMEANPSTRPYVDSFLFKGFIECSTTTIAVGFAACSAPNGATCDIDPAIPCSGNVTNDNFLVRYPVSRAPDWIQSEMVWESTQSAGDQMNLMYSWTCPEADPFYCDHEVRGSSPLLLAANATVVKTMGLGSNSTELILRVFNTWNDATAPYNGTCTPDVPDAPVGAACPRGTGATIEQSFNVYTHVFYSFTPPAGYRFTRDGEPKVPQ